MGGLAAPALFFAAGVGLQALLPRPLESGLLARFGFAYLLGTSWCTIAVWIANGVGAGPVSRASFLVAGTVAVVAGAAAISLRRGDLGGWRCEPRPSRRRSGWVSAAVTMSMLVLSAGLLADALVHPVADFDGRMVWGTLARYVEAEESVLPATVTDPGTYVIHPRYPLVLPLAQVAAAQISGNGIESRAIRPLYALFFPAFFWVLLPTLRRCGGPAIAPLVALAFLAAPVVLWNREVGPRGTYSDFPLAAILAGGAAILLHPRSERAAWRGAVAGLLLAAAVGVKNEGIALAPLVVAAAALGARRGRRRAALAAAVVVAVAVAGVVLWRAQIPNRNDEAYFESFSLPALVAGFADRMPSAFEVAVSESLSWQSWGWLFWLLPWLGMAGLSGFRRHGARFAIVWLAGHAAMIVAAYSVFGDRTLVAVTWNRFLVQMLAPLTIVAATAARATLLAARWRR